MNYVFVILQVLDYLGVAEVIDTMEDLVQFLRDISPALSRAAREVSTAVPCGIKARQGDIRADTLEFLTKVL